MRPPTLTSLLEIPACEGAAAPAGPVATASAIDTASAVTMAMTLRLLMERPPCGLNLPCRPQDNRPAFLSLFDANSESGDERCAEMCGGPSSTLRPSPLADRSEAR